MLHVEEVNSVTELADRRLVWDALLPQTRDATFFQSLAWLTVYWKHYGAEQRLRALFVYDGREPVGILPLVVRREPTKLGAVPVLTYPLHDWGSFFGPIGPNPTATLLAALKHIHATRRDWDLLELRWVDLAGGDQGRTAQAMEQVGYRAAQQPWAVTALADLGGTWDAYWADRGKKWRHNVCRLQRRLEEVGQIRHVRYRPAGSVYDDGDPRFDLYDASVEVARKSWQGSSTTGTTLSHASVAEFLRETHAAAAHAGAVDMNLLYLGDRPIAFVYNYFYNRRIYGLRMGYDPEFEQQGPGTVLQRLIIEDSFRRGDAHYDMGICYLEGKRPWQTKTGMSYRYSYFPPAVSRAQLLRLKRWVMEKIYGPDCVVCAKIG